jgi:D-sedoheptulose 7-phosphate isomerase
MTFEAEPWDTPRVLAETASRLTGLADDHHWLAAIDAAAQVLFGCLSTGGGILACGNGGSMTDAMHFASELSGRYRLDREPLRATAICDPSHITAVANDFGFEFVFSRAVEAMGKEGDVLVAISTSGNSRNVCLAAEAARARDMPVIGLTGRPDSPLGQLSDVEICTGTTQWADRAQEVHGVALHIVTARIEWLSS